ncbi:unnamed protein product, partial [Adineta ricciae]
NEQTYNFDGVEVGNLYLEMNEIIQSVSRCIDEIFSIIRPRKLIYMAIDGVAPRAKMHQECVSLFNYPKEHASVDEQFTKCYIKFHTMLMSKLSDKL